MIGDTNATSMKNNVIDINQTYTLNYGVNSPVTCAITESGYYLINLRTELPSAQGPIVLGIGIDTTGGDWYQTGASTGTYRGSCTRIAYVSAGQTIYGLVYSEVGSPASDCSARLDVVRLS